MQDHIDFFRIDDAYRTSVMSRNDVAFAKKIYDKAKFYELPVDKDSIDDLFENWTYENKEDLLKYCN
jgi:spore coat polysaccharide biosynthesis protein SpsF (cytidylyltransferase family)